jgi:NAD(P)-dependent dehydrogenase (short-subunit alcohol dehydrogenase family)
MAERAPQRAGETVVAITGAASGIGRALALRYARSGARLGLLDRDAAGLDAVAAELAKRGTEVQAVACDVTRWEDCKSAIDSILDTYGGVDVLINNAGITHVSPFADTDVDVVRRVMDVNFFGALHCTRAALASLVARRGLVIVLSSVAGFSPLAGRCAYSASKHALHGLFETLRSEQQESGLGVMMVCPGFTRTRIESHALGGDGRALQAPRSVYGRQADPDEVAEAIFRAALRRRRLLVLSPVGKLSYAVSRVWPALFERMMSRRVLAAPAGSAPDESKAD